MSFERRLRGGLGAATRRAIEENRIVGAVTAVMRNGALVHHEAHGLADRESSRAMTPDAIFLLASATKPITAAAAIALMARGLFDLDTPVTRFLPGFRPRFGETTPTITVRHLLTHTAGLYYPFQEPADGPMHRADVSSGLDLPGLPGDEAMRRLASVPLRFAPGSAYNYSLALDVLGEFMAAATGSALPMIVRDAVTGRLGMRDTDFAIADALRLVTHYGVGAHRQPVRMGETYWGTTLVSPARMSPRRLFDPASYPSGGAGMAGTAEDFVRFVDALRLHGNGVLPASGIRQMTTNALPGHIVQALDPGWTYGLGVETLSDPVTANGPERPGAFRGSGGYGHRWWADPALGLAVVVMTNTAPEGVRGRFVADAKDAVYAAV